MELKFFSFLKKLFSKTFYNRESKFLQFINSDRKFTKIRNFPLHVWLNLKFINLPQMVQTFHTEDKKKISRKNCQFKVPCFEIKLFYFSSKKTIQNFYRVR